MQYDCEKHLWWFQLKQYTNRYAIPVLYFKINSKWYGLLEIKNFKLHQFLYDSLPHSSTPMKSEPSLGVAGPSGSGVKRKAESPPRGQPIKYPLFLKQESGFSLGGESSNPVKKLKITVSTLEYVIFYMKL